MSGGPATKIKGANETIATVCEYSNSLATIDTFHERIHAGELYMASYSVASLASSDALEFLVVCDVGSPIHIRIRASCGTDATLGIFEGTTTSSDGTELTVYNVNRSSSNTSDTTVFHTPTITGDGTQIVNVALPERWGSIQEIPEEIILAASTKYLIRITNVGSGPSIASGLLDLYPH